VPKSSNFLSGKWELLTSGNSSENSIVLETWEFLGDGVYTDTTTDISGDKNISTGSYEILDDNHVEIISSSDSRTFEFSISGNELTLSSDKEVLKFKQ